jgi:hypothetical protein
MGGLVFSRVFVVFLFLFDFLIFVGFCWLFLVFIVLFLLVNAFDLRDRCASAHIYLTSESLKAGHFVSGVLHNILLFHAKQIVAVFQVVEV